MHQKYFSRRTKNRPEGFILIATYLIVTLIAAFSFAAFARSSAFWQASEKTQNRIIAFNMAESAVDFALAQLAANPSYAGTNGYVSITTPNVRGGFSVVVTTPANNANVRIIQASGFSPDNVNTTRGYQAASVVAYGQSQPSSSFNFGVFAQNGISLTGNATIDSYNSANGAYSNTNKSNDGDIATNGIASGAVSLSGNATVKGDTTVGQNGNTNVAIKLSGNATILGTKSAATSPFSYTAKTTSMASSGPLSISGNTTLYLLAGTYRYDSIKISGNGSLSIKGPVKIYVDGSLDITGNGIATQNNLPTNCLIYVTGSSDVKIAGNGALYAGVYAPNSDVQNTGNGALYGAVVSKTYTQTGNGDVHFDQALKNTGSSNSTRLTVSAWQEQNSLSWGTGS